MDCQSWNCLEVASSEVEPELAWLRVWVAGSSSEVVSLCVPVWKAMAFLGVVIHQVAMGDPLSPRVSALVVVWS